jgi:hypothetical protein
MSDPDRPDRRLEFTLVARELEKVDPSILDAVRVAIEDGLRAATISAAPSAPEQSPDPPERHALDENLETQARKQIENALDEVMRRFEQAGGEPKFDVARWVEQLLKVWTVIAKAKAAGVKLTIAPADAAAPPTPGS